MKKNLKKRLQNWDGIHKNYPIAIYEEYHQEYDFFDQIIGWYLLDISLQKITSWLMKYHYDNEQQLSDKQISKILSGIYQLDHWESKLHILQLIPHFNINIILAEQIEAFVRACLYAEKKFVKASAYEAYFEIVRNIPTLKEEFKLLCEDALIKESASIKAKVRKLIKRLEYI